MSYKPRKSASSRTSTINGWLAADLLALKRAERKMDAEDKLLREDLKALRRAEERMDREARAYRCPKAPIEPN